MKRETYKQYKKRVLHPQDDLFAILFINFITIKLAYIITRFKIGITPNAVTYIRMFIISPLIIILLIVAPILRMKILYLIVLTLSYIFLLSDWLDGQIARGMNKTSKKGAILDSIADRFSTIIFLVVIFSIGVLYSSMLIVSLSIILFALKCFHMMIITKLYYYEVGNKTNSQKIFDGADAMGKMGVSKVFSTLKSLSRKVGIKKWGGTLGGSDRFFITVMLPIILILLDLHYQLLILTLLYIIFLSLFFLLRIKNLFKQIQ